MQPPVVQGTVVQGTVVQQGLQQQQPIAYGQPGMGYQQYGGGQPYTGPQYVGRKPRTLLDPCPVNYEESSGKRLLRYTLAIFIVVSLLAAAIVLLWRLVMRSEECGDLSDDKAACEANSECRWFGPGSSSWRASWTGDNCASN
eukprot:CAMPEP_0169119804 /NCGR_PEP_ID=MMETSP1015-20121227/31761_1 /TAXON_ID=342587 /ORGANISM="Karlodinium micrum, Strain CCMP2283" /LENGTH=142 /DNA_ID=CAMNT_0009182727 /DNA_START=30 /DNA_END=458 /DNA_ORIENTATION=+